MADSTQSPRSLLSAVEAALAAEDEGYARYRRSRQRTGENATYRPAPLSYDESGFPIPQHRAGLTDRVARLLGA